MNKVLSEVLFNRALIWMVVALFANDKGWPNGAYIVLAILNVVESLMARVWEDA